MGGVVIKSSVYKILEVLAHQGMVAMFCLTSLNLKLSFIIVLMADDVLKDLPKRLFYFLKNILNM